MEYKPLPFVEFYLIFQIGCQFQRIRLPTYKFLDLRFACVLKYQSRESRNRRQSALGYLNTTTYLWKFLEF